MRHLLLLASLAVAGCKAKADDREAAIGKFRYFTGRMCDCKDSACAEIVNRELAEWSAEMARESKDETRRPDERQMKIMQDLAQEFGKCATKVLSGKGPDDPLAFAPPPPGGGPVRAVDLIVKHTFDNLPTGFGVRSAEFRYVRADGTLDAQYGEVQVETLRPRRPPPADDPSRPIGAPVPPDPDGAADYMAKCPTYRWKGGTRTESERLCMTMGDEAITRPKCSALEVWKQAIEAGAPETALAVLELHGTSPLLGDKQRWTISIDDTPRNIHFSHEVPDTCEPTLEKPTPVKPAPPPTTPGKKPNPY